MQAFINKMCAVDPANRYIISDIFSDPLYQKLLHGEKLHKSQLLADGEIHQYLQ